MPELPDIGRLQSLSAKGRGMPGTPRFHASRQSPNQGHARLWDLSDKLQDFWLLSPVLQDPRATGMGLLGKKDYSAQSPALAPTTHMPGNQERKQYPWSYCGKVRGAPGKTGKNRAQPRMLGWVGGPYLWKTKVQCSVASHHGTGASEPHQGVPTPPGRNIWPPPQRPQGPVKIGLVHSMSSFVCCISFHSVFV